MTNPACQVVDRMIPGTQLNLCQNTILTVKLRPYYWAVAAIGTLADRITSDHPQDYGYGEDSPLAKLVEANGRILMVGAP